jgi:hypothetical protein
MTGSSACADDDDVADDDRAESGGTMIVQRRGAAIEIAGLRKEYHSGPGRNDKAGIRLGPVLRAGQSLARGFERPANDARDRT